MIPVMDWTAGGTLGSEAGEYEGREGGRGSKGQCKWNCGEGNGPDASMHVCFQCHQEDTQQVKAIKTSSISAPTHFCIYVELMNRSMFNYSFKAFFAIICYQLRLQLVATDVVALNHVFIESELQYYDACYMCVCFFYPCRPPPKKQCSLYQIFLFTFSSRFPLNNF